MLTSKTLRWVGVFFVIHLVLSIGTGLSPDEAHYALYGVHLDWSYFDHPPLVGWLQWLPANWMGSNWSLRLVPMIAWLLSVGLILKLEKIAFEQSGVDLVKNQFSPATLFFLICPMFNLLGFALVPDTLLLPLSCAIMWVTWRLIQSKTKLQLNVWPWWVALGVLLGLAGLDKYTAVMLAFSTAVVLFKSEGLQVLKDKGLWACVSIAGVMVLPVLYWNETHHWISIAYQFAHASGKNDWQMKKSVTYLLILLLSYGPLMICSGVGVYYLRKTRPVFVHPQGAEGVQGKVSFEFLCMVFGAPLLLLLTYTSGRGGTLPHWAAPAIVCLTPMISIGMQRLRQTKKSIVTSLVLFQLISTVGLMVLLMAGGLSKEDDQQSKTLAGVKAPSFVNNPFADLYGWDVAAQTALELAKESGYGTLAVSNWTLASRLAWYARPFAVKVIDSHHDQFDLWYGSLNTGESVIWVDWSMMTFSPSISKPGFEDCQLVKQVPVFRWGREISHFNFSICRNWQTNQNG